MEPLPTAMMTETQQYLEKIQAIADSTRSSPPSRKASLTSPTIASHRKASLTTAFAAATLDSTTDTGQPLMSSAERSQESTKESTKDDQQLLQAQVEAQSSHSETNKAREGATEHQPRRPPMPQGDSNTSSSSDMSDTKLSRFYHAMGSSESSNAERREAEERARREAEERARRESQGK